jgi:3'-5' exoribonuclease
MPSALPRIAALENEQTGTAFFLCVTKEQRASQGGAPYITLVLQDVSGQIPAKLFQQEAEQYGPQFEAGEFVKAEARTNVYRGRMELIVSRIRRVDRERDRAEGFREEDCILCAPRSADDMWDELQGRIAAVADPGIRVLLARIAADHEAQLRVWPAALTVHHAYRGGLLEHILQIARAGQALAEIYDADTDLVFAGAMLHDIGKLRELDYDVAPSYSREGNLVGHIAIGLTMIREASTGISGLAGERRAEIEHLVASHHGSKEFGSPVEPMMVEAFILSMVDDLDAKLHQVRRHLATDEGGGEFTTFHPRLKRVLLKSSDGRR